LIFTFPGETVSGTLEGAGRKEEEEEEEEGRRERLSALGAGIVA
jgi:hypothetical protein